MIDASGAAAGWSALHHGIDPRASRLLWAWLRFVWLIARPLARLRVPPIALTALGVGCAVAAIWPSHGIRPWLALMLVLASALCDGLDGAIAVLTDRASSFGSAADKIADRICDVCFVLVIWRCGADTLWTLITVVGVVAVEAVRQFAGGEALSTITVGERPTRVICAAIACIAAAVSSAHWPALVCVTVLLGLSVIALGQLAIVIRRDVRAT